MTKYNLDKVFTAITKDWLSCVEEHYLESSIGISSYRYATELIKMTLLYTMINYSTNQS